MPHLLIERTRWFPSLLVVSSRDAPQWLPRFAETGILEKKNRGPRLLAGAILLEILDLSASVTFLVGSSCFLPEYASNVATFMHGCDFFVFGSLIYCVVTTYTLVEAVKTKGALSFEAYENGLYLAGSASYLIGTWLYWPEPGHVAPYIEYMGGTERVSRPHVGDVMFELRRSTSASKMNETPMNFHLWKESFAQQHQHHKSSGLLSIDLNMYYHEWTGSVLFIIGSLFFTLAAFTNALKQRKFLEWNAVIISASSLYMAGSLQFVMGSVCFLPELGADWAMARFGAWCFISGSIMYMLGNSISLSRTLTEFAGADALQPLMPPAAADEAAGARMGRAIAASSGRC